MLIRPRPGARVVVPAALVVLPVLAGLAFSPPALSADAAVFPMKKVSLFDPAPAGQGMIGGGTSVRCTPTADTAVKVYPQLNSKNPLYGTIVFDRDPYGASEGVRRSFVLDESPEAQAAKAADEAEAAKKAKDAKAAGEKSPAVKLDEFKAVPAAPKTGAVPKAAAKTTAIKRLVLPQGMMSGIVRQPQPQPKCYYDRLYFDANGDGDLTNDPVIGRMKDPPATLRAATSMGVFEPIVVPDASGAPPADPMRVVPTVYVYNPQNAYFMLRAAHAWTGDVKIGAEEFTARLYQSSTISPRFDRPFTTLLLAPKQPGKQPTAQMYYSTFDMWLGSIRTFGGTAYEFEASPSGDKLMVKPFTGPKGKLEIAAGDRKVGAIGMAGTLISKRGGMTVGKMTYPSPEMVREAELPAGDYMAMSLSVQIGRVKTSMRPLMERTADGGSRYKPTYTVAIGPDKPFRLDFADKLKVVFQDPAPGKKFKPGDTVRIAAILVDPKLDLMVAGFQDTATVEREVSTRDEKGNAVKMPIYKTLNPTVRIVDAAGKELASGPMPFG